MKSVAVCVQFKKFNAIHQKLLIKFGYEPTLIHLLMNPNKSMNICATTLKRRKSFWKCSWIDGLTMDLRLIWWKRVLIGSQRRRRRRCQPSGGVSSAPINKTMASSAIFTTSSSSLISTLGGFLLGFFTASFLVNFNQSTKFDSNKHKVKIKQSTEINSIRWTIGNQQLIINERRTKER